MRRRQFVAGVGSVAATWPLAARAQKSPARIGYLLSGAANSAAATDRLTYLADGLREFGLAEGRDYNLETRFAAGDYSRFTDLGRELAQAGVSVIVTNTIAAVRAAQALRPALPIVMSSINDPVGAGLVASLARPGGMTTGMATLGEDLSPKLLDFQHMLLPKAIVLAALFNPANPSNPTLVDEIKKRSGAIGMTVVPVALPSPDALDAAFATMAAHRPDALELIGDSGTFDVSDRIAAAALALRLPSFAASPIYAKYGGLLGYGPAPQALYGRAAYYVKRILDGADPGELPVEQPTQIVLWINMRAAKALGVEVPQSLLVAADNLIE